MAAGSGKIKNHPIGWIDFLNLFGFGIRFKLCFCCDTIDFRSHPYRMRSEINGFSPGLKNMPPACFFPRFARSVSSIPTHLIMKKSLLPIRQVLAGIELCRPWRHRNLPRPKKHATGMFFPSLRSVGLFDSHTSHYEKIPPANAGGDFFMVTRTGIEPMLPP